ncbi:hypothetical protein L1O48_05470 [Ligilactobacillus equi]|uniref:hypothetical protein n=1 Tax=Ligilactobacillus equi TaxID=137357 RepID=UPI002ED371A4
MKKIIWGLILAGLCWELFTMSAFAAEVMVNKRIEADNISYDIQSYEIIRSRDLPKKLRQKKQDFLILKLKVEVDEAGDGVSDKKTYNQLDNNLKLVSGVTELTPILKDSFFDENQVLPLLRKAEAFKGVSYKLPEKLAYGRTYHYKLAYEVGADDNIDLAFDDYKYKQVISLTKTPSKNGVTVPWEE